METIQAWAGRKRLVIEPYGLDIAPDLAKLARKRLPRWAGRIFVGNAIDWQPPMRFDFVRVGLEYVPRRRQPDLLAHLLEKVVAPDGRLIIGVYNEAGASLTVDSIEDRVKSWGFAIAGRSERQHSDCRVRYRAIWIDRPDRT
jgi:hypothetical protein